MVAGTALRRRNSPQPHHRGQLRPSATHWYQCLGSPPHHSVIPRVVTNHTTHNNPHHNTTLSDKILWFLNHSINTSVWPKCWCIILCIVNPRPKAQHSNAAQRSPIFFQHVSLRPPTPAPWPRTPTPSWGNVPCNLPPPQPTTTADRKCPKTKVPFQNAKSCAKPERKV